MSNKKNIFFTIIVPCYNVELYIEECIKNIRLQSYNNYRILLINDGSTDHTEELIYQAAMGHSDIIYLNSNAINEGINNANDCNSECRQATTQNYGLVTTRNRGLVYALEEAPVDDKGYEWIIFLDADDTLLQETLEKINTVICNNTSLDFILTDFCYIYQKDPSRNKHVSTGLDAGLYQAKEIGKNFESKIPWSVISCIGTKIYNSDFIRRTGLRFSDYYKYNEDGAFSIQAFSYADKVYYINYPCYQYLQRDGSIMHSYRPNYYATLDHVVDLYGEYLETVNTIGKTALYRKRIHLVLEAFINELRFHHYKEYNDLFDSLAKDIKVRKAAKIILFNNESLLKNRIFAILLLLKMRGLIKWYISEQIL